MDRDTSVWKGESSCAHEVRVRVAGCPGAEGCVRVSGSVHWVRVMVGGGCPSAEGCRSLLSRRKWSVSPVRKAAAGCRVGSISQGVSLVSAAICPLPALTPLFHTVSPRPAPPLTTTTPIPSILPPPPLSSPPPDSRYEFRLKLKEAVGAHTTTSEEH